MKKFILSLGLVAMMLNLTNCAQYEDVDPTVEPQGEFALYAPISRTANDDLNTVWKAGDNLTVFHAEAGATTYVYDAEFKLESAETGRFTGTLESALTAEAYDWYAIYPHSSYNSSKTPEFTAYTPIGCSHNGTQTQDGNNSMAHIAGENYPLVGVAKGVANGTAPAVAMTNVASLLKVVVTNSLEEPITVTDVAFTAPAEIVGTFNIDFAGDNISATSSGDSFTDDIARLKVNKGAAIAKGETAEFYLAIAPFTAVANSELKIAVTALSETNDKGVHEKSITLSKDVTFASGKIKTLEVNYNTPIVAEVLPSVSTDTADHFVGFESSDGFVANSIYNNIEEVLTGATGQQWATIYGTPSTTSPINGSQSMQMRWYKDSASNIGYTYTNFTLSTVNAIAFQAMNTNNLNVVLSYKTAGADWVDVKTFTLSTTAKQYTHTFDTAVKNAQFKFTIVLPATLPTSTSRVYIDDVTFSATEIVSSVDVTTADASATESEDGTTATLNGQYVVANGTGSEVVTCGFEYRLSSASEYTSVNATSAVAFSYNLTNLTPETEYTFRAWASLDGGTTKSYGDTKTFTTTIKEQQGIGDTVVITYDFHTKSSYPNNFPTSGTNVAAAKEVEIGGNKLIINAPNSYYMINSTNDTLRALFFGKTTSTFTTTAYLEVPAKEGYVITNITIHSGASMAKSVSCNIYSTTGTAMSTAVSPGKDVDVSYDLKSPQANTPYRFSSLTSGKNIQLYSLQVTYTPAN